MTEWQLQVMGDHQQQERLKVVAMEMMLQKQMRQRL
jgi:hypothetical protein